MTRTTGAGFNGEYAAQKIAHSGNNERNACGMAAVFAREAMETIETSARTVLANCSEGDALRTNLSVLKRFTKYEPMDAIRLGISVAHRLELGRPYTFVDATNVVRKDRRPFIKMAERYDCE